MKEQGMADLVVGVDLGGTNTSVGVVDESGRQILHETFPTHPRESAAEFVVRLAGAIHELVGKLGPGAALRGIGIASPAANALRGTIESPANLGWGTVNIVEMVRKHFTIPVSVTNDANAALLGEQRFGVALGMKNVILLTLGTGLGAGISVDGRLLEGENGSAGEIGHMTVDPGGRMCGCGRRGCVETYVSASGVRRTVLQLLAERLDDSPLRGISFNDLTAETVSRLASGRDPVALEALTTTGVYLGRLVANLAAAFDPEAVVLYGGLVNAGEILVGPARLAFEKYAMKAYQGKVRILVSSLNNGEAAVLGAGCHVRGLLSGVEAA